MQFKGRTVVFYVVLTMVVTCIATVMFIETPIFTALKASGNYTEGMNKEDIRKLNETIKMVESRFYTEIKHDKLIDGAVTGIMQALGDPYSEYLTKEVAADFESTISGKFSGVGAEVSMEEGNVTIQSPIKGSPAEKAGLLPKDIIISVDGNKAADLSLTEVVNKIRGPRGTKVRIAIKREETTEPIEFVIVRDDIEQDTVYSKILPNHVGYLDIRMFSLNTGQQFEGKLKELEKNQLKGLIIDVRNNPGGSLDAVQYIAEQFVPKDKIIVQMEDRYGRKEKALSKHSYDRKYPVSILVNSGSASASEVLAGALSDHGIAKVIGETSFGKGTVQVSIDEVGDGSLIKMTIAKWLTPKGTWVHKKGIQPDVTVTQPNFFSVMGISKKETLEYDMNHPDVKAAQIMLNGLGYKLSRDDGYFDEDMLKAVKAFQKAYKLPITGKIDQATANLLEERIREKIKDSKNDAQLNKAMEVMTKQIKAS